MDPRLKEQVRADWRKLGFFYDRNDVRKEWLIVGSRAGLLKFVEVLRAYAGDPAHDRKSEHEHYGPYMYLELMTRPEPGMDNHAIFGPLSSLNRLAEAITRSVERANPGDHARIHDDFAADAQYSLVLDVRDDGFDPASADAAVGE